VGTTEVQLSTVPFEGESTGLRMGDKMVTNLLYGVSQVPIDFPAAPPLA
jgi:hypothetical protein